MAKLASTGSQEHRSAIKEIAEGRDYNVADVVISDLMLDGLVRREGTDRVLTVKGEQVHRQIMASGDGPEA
jgi:hypothetical protein